MISSRQSKLDDPDLEQRMNMVVNASVWRPIVAFVIAFAAVFTASDIFALLNHDSATSASIFPDERDLMYWLLVAANAAVTAMIGIPVLVAARNKYNSTLRNAFTACLLVVCIAFPMRAAFAGGTFARLTADLIALLFALICAACLYAERQYVKDAEAEVDRRLEELGYDEY